MAWRTDSTGNVFTCYPYRIEKRNKKFKLYKYVLMPGDHWSMKLIGKYEYLEDAKASAAADKEQISLWGE